MISEYAWVNGDGGPRADFLATGPLSGDERVAFLSLDNLLVYANQAGCKAAWVKEPGQSYVLVRAPMGYLFCTEGVEMLTRDLPKNPNDLLQQRQIVAELMSHIGQGFYRIPRITLKPQRQPEPVDEVVLYVI